MAPLLRICASAALSVTTVETSVPLHVRSVILDRLQTNKDCLRVHLALWDHFSRNTADIIARCVPLENISHKMVCRIRVAAAHAVLASINQVQAQLLRLIARTARPENTRLKQGLRSACFAQVEPIRQG